MKKFNLKKMASSKDYVISDKSIQENREKMSLSNDQQGVVGKNINFSLPIKDKDNTIPFNAQLEAERKNTEAEPSITEASMDKKEVNFGDKTEGVMPINVKTQEYDKEKTEAFKKAEGKKNTAFWDKYVGVQLEGEGQPTKVKDNIPASASQLQNNPERFKRKGIDKDVKEEGLNLKVDKMVMASIKDADAMLYHIYAGAVNSDRTLNKEEKQQIVDINSGKMRLMVQARGPVNYSEGVKIYQGQSGKGIVKENGQVIDTFSSVAEAKTNYPEAEIWNPATIPFN